jgi:hypothetical protein
MKKLLLFVLVFPMLMLGQIESSLKLKVGVLNNFISKGDSGERLFWETKGKITFGFVNYTEEQNPIFRDLFIKQYKEIVPIFEQMNKTELEKDTHLFVIILIKQEEEYRNLLKPDQLKRYLEQLADFEKNNPDANNSYSSLFFSEKLLNEYKKGFL